MSIFADLIYADGGVLPAAQDQGTVYLSSNPDLATVSADGVVTVASRFREGDVVIMVGNQGVVGTISLSVHIPAHIRDQDSDGDGMPDRWELLYGFDPQDPGDAALDPDGDALTNLGEYQAGTNPLRPDTDADGLSDGSDPEPLIPELEPPQVVLTAPLPGGTVVAGADIAIAGSAVDNAVVRRLTVFLDGLPVDVRVGGGTFAFAVPTTGLEGVRRVEVRAVDAAGNIGAAGVDVEILPPPNRPPVVDAGADQTVTGLLARLAGAVTDDGLPNPPGAVTIDWRLVTGPGSVEIATRSQAVTDVVVSEPGTYRFVLVASDSVLTASDVVDVTFNESTATQGAPDDRIHLISRRRAQENPLANAQMGRIAMTPDGRWIAFATGASNLVTDDGNASDDCFLWDRTTRRIERVSLPDGGPEAGAQMVEVSLSDDASRVAFLTYGDALIPGDTNRNFDLLLRDRAAVRTLPVAVGEGGALPSFGTDIGSLSGNGRFAVFSTRNSLVPEDTSGGTDVYVRDIFLGVTELISVNSFGMSGNGSSTTPAISRDGRYVVFTSSASDLVDGDVNAEIDVFVRDRWSGITTLISRGLDGFSANGRSNVVRLSADGNAVAFESTASNLVAGDGNGARDVFLYGLADGSLRRIVLDDLGHDTAGTLRAISGDGRRLLLERALVSATAMVVRDVDANQSFPVPAPPELTVSSSSYQRATAILSQTGDLVLYGLRSLGSSGADATIMVYQVDADAYVDQLHAPDDIVQGVNGHQVRSDAVGRFVAFTSSSAEVVDGDGNGTLDVFVFDRRTGAMARVSVASDGTQGDGYAFEPAISGDGRFVAFSSTSSNLVAEPASGQNVFVHDRETGETRCVSIRPDGLPAGGTSRASSISGDGRWIVFSSTATDLVADDTNGVEDVFLHDQQTGSTLLISRIPGGNPGNGRSWTPMGTQAISADGQRILFLSTASDLVAGDTNGAGVDVVLYRRDDASLAIISRSASGGQVANVDEPGLSPDGMTAVFRSHATGVVASDTATVGKIYLRDLVAGSTFRVSNSTAGGSPNNWSFAPAVSADGRFVIFYSRASNLVVGDTNGDSDAFVYDRLFGTTVRASVSTDGWQANDETSGSIWISADGRFIFFDSRAYNLVPGLPPFAGPWAFGAPTPKGVSAGPDQHGEVNTAIALSGRAPSGATVLWSMVQGPEQPLIVEPALPATTAWFPEPGVYLLRLTATLGAISDADEAQITVVPPLAPDANN